MESSFAFLENIEIRGAVSQWYNAMLTPEALVFLAALNRQFNSRRKQLLQNRIKEQEAINQGILPNFLAATEYIRNDMHWGAAAIPDELQDRKVEITGPVDRKMIINALNSGAKVFMADFEDANSPTWRNCIEGQMNLYNAIRKQIDFVGEQGKAYKLNEKTAVLMVRPRGWHLEEKHVLVDNQPMSASLFDFGLYFFHNAKELLQRGTAPYFYLPKMENHEEARLWNDVFVFAQKTLDIPQGTIKATVLIETILAVFQMDEIIYELREHIAGLNAGRWDYLFSAIKKFAKYPDKVMPDRSQLTMQTPFMRAYALLLVKTCHQRNVHAMGGMAAFIPSRKDAEINRNAFAKVKADKTLEASTGFDGTWVAHPDLVPIALEEFNKVLGEKPNQKDVFLPDLQITAKQLIDFKVPEGKITEQGLRTNINIGILYIESWLMGTGAAALHNLMEDAATAEISRGQVWQWLNHHAYLDDGREITVTLYKQLFNEELQKIRDAVGERTWWERKYENAARLFDKLVMATNFEPFLTNLAYTYLA